MRKKLMTVFMAGTLVLGGIGVAGVAKADPDPNGPAKKGLCTAYFNGQKKGHDGGSPGPFAGLEAAAEGAEGGLYGFCGGVEGIGGNPDHGRFPECFDDVEDNGGDVCPDQ